MTQLRVDNGARLRAKRSRDWFAVALLALAGFGLQWRMLRYGLPVGGDYFAHLYWLPQFFQELSAGMWYPRWLADSNFGYGNPTFVFYPPLVFYIGSALLAVGLDLETAMRGLLILADIGRAVTCFIALRYIVQDRLAAFTGAAFYLAAPYAALNAYRRGALPENWSLVWLPLALWLTLRAVRLGRPSAGLALVFALLFITNIPSFLMASTAFGMLLLILFVARPERWRGILSALVSAGLGAALAAVYLLPAALEQKLVELDSFRLVSGGVWANFLPKFGGARLFPTYIVMGGIAAIAGITLIQGLALRGAHDAIRRHIFAWALFAAVIALLMTPLSTPLWWISVLEMIQFPWRFTGIFSLALAGFAAWTVVATRELRGLSKIVLGTAVSALLLIQLTGWFVITQRYPTVRDYLPRDERKVAALRAMLTNPFANSHGDERDYRPRLPDGSVVADPLPDTPPLSVVDGTATTAVMQWQTRQRIVVVNASSPAQLRIRTYAYPAWQLRVNGEKRDSKVLDHGAIGVSVPSGRSTITLDYGWTPAFRAGFIVSASVGILLSIYAFACRFPPRPMRLRRL